MTGININDGISQKERYPASLDPDYFKIDERTAAEVILFIIELSFQYNYFNDQNEDVSDWSGFFISDPDLMLQLFRKKDFQNFFWDYNRTKQELLRAENRDDFLKKLDELINKTIEPPLKFHDKIYNVFKAAIAKLDDGYAEFKNIIAEPDYVYGTWTEYDEYKNLKEKIARYKANEKDEENFPLDIPGNLKTFDQLYKKLEIVHGRLLAVTSRFKQQRQLENITYSPHISMVLAFSELYQTVRDELNGLNRRHLDYYFKKMLDFSLHKASPDKVAVIVELAANVNELLLLKGEKLLVAGDTNQTFSLSENQWINQAKIAALKTVYKNGYNPLQGAGVSNTSFNNYRIYAAEIPLPGVEDFKKNINSNKSWPMFGEDQHYLPADSKTMYEAELGLMIASPVLYAADGKREFTVSFHLNDDSFKEYFIDYVAAYSKGQRQKPKVIITEMLKKAFCIDITGLTGWIRISDYSATYAAQVTGNDESKQWKEFTAYPDKYVIQKVKNAIIKIGFVLGKADPAVAVFQPAIHGPAYKIDRPVLRLMLNNDTALHPYGFLFKQGIERITVNVDVQESLDFKLQNNIGQVASSGPFQIFGPQPAIGSFVALKNTNIFNRFTKLAGVKFTWIDLPRMSGGFKTYYNGYGVNMSNESFKVGFSGLINNQYLPKRDGQDLLNLFESEDSVLQETTNFTDIMSHNIRFENDPKLNKEYTGNPDFKEGAIRIELIEPETAFCQNLYPVLLPKVLIHNAKWYNRKLPVPNQPFIPVIGSVSVNYQLEHTEKIFGKKLSAVQSDIELWHIYPFGYRKVYPGENNKEIIIIPTIERESNFLIALSDVKPGNELSILFQLEENNVEELKEEGSEPVWSYLSGNEWTAFDKLDILEDNTIGFKGPGIVKLKLPYNISTGNTLLDARYYWIRVSCDRPVGAKIRAVFAQAVTAVRDLDTDAENTKALLLNPFMIREFSRKIPGISTVYQSFYSYNGRPAETTEKFYARVSERLRHKQRPIINSDISQKILELFPEIDTVMCFSRTELETEGYSVEGEMLKIVVIPKLKYIDDKRIVRPQVNTYILYKIVNYISANLSPFIKKENITVCNPEYERLKVFCSVSFKKDVREIRHSLAIQELNMDICKFISPWLFSVTEEIDPETNIYPSKIFNFISNLPYIARVDEFKVVHFYASENNDGKLARIIDSNVFTPVYGDEIPFLYKKALEEKSINGKLFFKRSKPGAVITTADEHSISLSRNNVNEMAGEKKVLKTGIGQLAIGDEFLVMDAYEVSQYAGIETSRPELNEDLDFNFYTKS